MPSPPHPEFCETASWSTRGRFKHGCGLFFLPPSVGLRVPSTQAADAGPELGVKF